MVEILRRDCDGALDLTRKRRVDTVIIAMPWIGREYLAQVVDKASLSFRHVIVILNLSGFMTSVVSARALAGAWGMETKYNLLDPWALRVKRALDLGYTKVGGTLIFDLPPRLGKHARTCFLRGPKEWG